MPLQPTNRMHLRHEAIEEHFWGCTLCASNELQAQTDAQSNHVVPIPKVLEFHFLLSRGDQRRYEPMQSQMTIQWCLNHSVIDCDTQRGSSMNDQFLAFDKAANGPV